MVLKRTIRRSPASDVHASSSGSKSEFPAELATSSNPNAAQSALPKVLSIERPADNNGASDQPWKSGDPVSYGDGDEDDEDDEDSLDELDDLLDEFNAGSSSKPANNVHGETSAQGSSMNQPSLDSLDDDFAKQLQQGMADLLKEMEESPEFQAQFDSLVQELDKSAGSAPNPPGNGNEAMSTPGTSERQPQIDDEVAQGASSFHDTIAKTMERMKESGAEIDTEMADSQSDDFLAEMLRQMQMATGRGGSDEDFSKMLMGMMEQLTNKEILYEPMKELDEKFPSWLVENEGKHSGEEMDNFREQARLVREIVMKFEQPSFSDSSEIDREYIVERMQKMQAVGSPPAELLGDMGQGDGLPPDIENCPVQ
ncbi:Peroxisome chaperone and import receptor [Orbilia oligospora]|uniref:Peroxisome chaperone and import receptor n=1 Tax=Orbilia oligospora TaxID=2813651 RepID=A0A6G1M133_ORBOL|nr:Peroxisome chaperone and import receptor [Orbilia oligospora]KAF3204371.1 Peroxisome chaperone and import receptor [Orbilia oligospora]KAF3214328.1 Peroxisome chaperone and import receptor [Orbilia oligospora]KAF3241472.1 Peroxisome chaperone and import receptor [Orbilia oligospora]